MRTRWTTLVAAAAGTAFMAVCAVGPAPVSAQPAPAASAASGGAAPYVHGGAGEEERAALTARQAEFPFKLVLSDSGGGYVVADRLAVSRPGAQALVVRDAGPVIMLKLPAGSYTFEATWNGRTERRAVAVGSTAQTLVWRLPG